jgi:dUTP pyrophosphatase
MTTENDVYLHFVKLTEHALTPTPESPNSASFAMRSSRDAIVPARGKELMKTDLRINLPAGCYGRITPRKDLDLFHHITIGVGVTDEDYCGNLSVLLYNRSEKPYTICRGDRIAI